MTELRDSLTLNEILCYLILEPLFFINLRNEEAIWIRLERWNGSPYACGKKNNNKGGIIFTGDAKLGNFPMRTRKPAETRLQKNVLKVIWILKSSTSLDEKTEMQITESWKKSREMLSPFGDALAQRSLVDQ